MAEIYAAKDDYWQDTLRQMGYYMGKFIYLMDAYDDVEKIVRMAATTHLRSCINKKALKKGASVP